MEHRKFKKSIGRNLIFISREKKEKKGRKHCEKSLILTCFVIHNI